MSGPETFDTVEFYTKVCAGQMASWVARPTRPLSTVARSVATVARKRGITPYQLSALAREVQELSVDPFGLERIERFEQLTAELRAMGAL